MRRWPRELVLASSNRGKLEELRAILGVRLDRLGVRLRSLADFPATTLPPEGDAYAPNAVAKALAAARATGRLAVGDDSGLEVETLGFAPGPLSARFGGPGLDDGQRCARLLEALAGVAAARRGARFVCVAALATPDGDAVTARGECAGRILEAPRGQGGFGYDPVFQPEGFARSMAELAADEKNRISHRARAFGALAETIEARLCE
ncbi:MAG TPA: non-canonical purine NTP pyrophosphatase [Myxococcota bacterium]|nr:non-canonical purine NTP pyrophosphatase [Myxococcota bacterium]